MYHFHLSHQKRSKSLITFCFERVRKQTLSYVARVNWYHLSGRKCRFISPNLKMHSHIDLVIPPLGRSCRSTDTCTSEMYPGRGQGLLSILFTVLFLAPAHGRCLINVYWMNNEWMNKWMNEWMGDYVKWHMFKVIHRNIFGNSQRSEMA